MSPKAEEGFVEVPRALAPGTFTNPPKAWWQFSRNITSEKEYNAAIKELKKNTKGSNKPL